MSKEESLPLDAHSLTVADLFEGGRCQDSSPGARALGAWAGHRLSTSGGCLRPHGHLHKCAADTADRRRQGPCEGSPCSFWMHGAGHNATPAPEASAEVSGQAPCPRIVGAPWAKRSHVRAGSGSPPGDGTQPKKPGSASRKAGENADPGPPCGRAPTGGCLRRLQLLGVVGVGATTAGEGVAAPCVGGACCHGAWAGRADEAEGCVVAGCHVQAPPADGGPNARPAAADGDKSGAICVGGGGGGEPPAPAALRPPRRDRSAAGGGVVGWRCWRGRARGPAATAAAAG